jgi:hypothetical protein
MSVSPGGVASPLHGDVVVYHQPPTSTLPSAGRYILRQYPDTSGGDEHDGYDDAVAAASERAAIARVNVFYCDLPGQPVILKQFRVD